MKLLTPRIAEALKTALTAEIIGDPKELLKGVPTPSSLPEGFSVLQLLESRPLVVSIQAGVGGVLVGCGDGIMSDTEVEAMREYGEVISRTLEEVHVNTLERVHVKGVGYLEEEKVGDQPRGVLPVSGVVELLYYSKANAVLLPYRFSRIKLGDRRELRITLPRSFLKTKLKATHPVYGTAYSGSMAGIEVDVSEFLALGAPSLGVVASRSRLKVYRVMYVLGDEDLRELLSNLGCCSC